MRCLTSSRRVVSSLSVLRKFRKSSSVASWQDSQAMDRLGLGRNMVSLHHKRYLVQKLGCFFKTDLVVMKFATVFLSLELLKVNFNLNLQDGGMGFIVF